MRTLLALAVSAVLLASVGVVSAGTADLNAENGTRHCYHTLDPEDPGAGCDTAVVCASTADNCIFCMSVGSGCRR